MSWRRASRTALALILAAVLPALADRDDHRGVGLAGGRGGITRIVVASRTPAFGGASFGSVGTYEYLTGTAYGAIDPDAPLNNGLVYLQNAPRNADGLVEYSMDVVVLRPTDASKGNHRLFYDVVNRGNPVAVGSLNRGTVTNPGNGFLMRQGYTVVWSGWQPEANPATATIKAYFPLVTNAGNPIVKPLMEVYVPDTPESGAGNTQQLVGNTLTAYLTYPPASFDPVAAHATLTVREQYADARIPLSSSAVTFVNDTTVRIDLSGGVARGMDQGAIYELVYDAKNPYVGGVGFASVRDLVSFLRNETRDSAGNENPARPGGVPIVAAYAWGNSQSGRFLKNMVHDGFNQDVRGRRVFDGMHAMVTASRMTDHNTPFAMTSRWIRQHEERNYPGADFPFTYDTLWDPLTRRFGGVLDVCESTGTCPKIFHVDSDLEVWHGRISLVVTDTMGNPVDLPHNVRAFMMSGQQHGPGNGTPGNLPVCKLQSNPVDDSPVYRALVVAMDDWVTRHVEPPASRYPNLKDRTLQTIEQFGAAWPRIPGFPFNSRYGDARVPDYSTEPPTYSQSYPVLFPNIDAIGNPYGGVISPDLAAPLGTYMGRNFRKAGHAEDELCAGNGGFIPLVRTKAARLASGDSRPSVEELYAAGAADFYSRRRAQVEKLIRARFVLPEELESLTNEVAFPQ
jgi:Alpha/beta hydrolase domain